MQDKITYGVIGLLLGIVVTWVFATSAVNGQNGSMMRMMGMRNMMNGGSEIMDNHGHDEEAGE